MGDWIQMRVGDDLHEGVVTKIDDASVTIESLKKVETEDEVMLKDSAISGQLKDCVLLVNFQYKNVKVSLSSQNCNSCFVMTYTEKSAIITFFWCVSLLTTPLWKTWACKYHMRIA